MSASLPAGRTTVFAHGWWLRDAARCPSRWATLCAPTRLVEIRARCRALLLMREMTFGQTRNFPTRRSHALQRRSGQRHRQHGVADRRALPAGFRPDAAETCHDNDILSAYRPRCASGGRHGGFFLQTARPRQSGGFWARSTATSSRASRGRYERKRGQPRVSRGSSTRPRRACGCRRSCFLRSWPRRAADLRDLRTAAEDPHARALRWGRCRSGSRDGCSALSPYRLGRYFSRKEHIP